ncbi:hypothetical protein Tco_1201520 [Tanacetum coccineum]
MQRRKNGSHAGTLACMRWNGKEELEDKSNLKTILLTKVLAGRQPIMLFTFIESVFPDINTAYPLHTIRHIDCLDDLAKRKLMDVGGEFTKSGDPEVLES